MKATGIVRRIDELGRVVIPKEIRRTLRIREGDPLEIFTDREGEVILKKYSPIGELGDFAKEYADSLHQTLSYTVAICDKDNVIAVSGNRAKDLLDRPLHDDIEHVMEHRERVLKNRKDGDTMLSVTLSDTDPQETYSSQVIVPIVAAGDAIGAVVMFGRDEQSSMENTEMKVCETAACFLGKQMEP